MIVVFDAECLLCDGTVQFLLKHDRRGVFQFASIQGATGQVLLAQAGLPLDDLQTLLLVDGCRSWQHTEAIFRVLSVLGWPWKAACLGRLVPRSVRDAAYRWVARNRYEFFGRAESCLMPPSDYATRFLA